MKSKKYDFIRFATEGSFPDWAQVEFNTAKTIDEIDVFTLQDAWASPSEPTEGMTFSSYGATAFDVQYWNGTAWATVTGGSVTGNDKVWRKFTFSPVSTTKIRVVVNGSPATLGYYSRITEIEAWGSTTPAQTWKQEFSYDRYGNRMSHDKWLGTTQQTLTTQEHPEIDDATNRFESTEGFTFDANGNVVVDAQGRQFTFNGDNKQTQVKDGSNNVVGTYYYDGEGKRVKKVTAAETTIFVYASGKLVEERNATTNAVQTSYIYAGSQLLATETSSGTNYTVTDNLGSPRVIVDGSGGVVSRRDFLPFGEELFADGAYRKTTDGYSTTGQDAVRQRFTGYQKDIETGLDFAEARMYENRHGRFTAIDPLLASGKSVDPQTFNRYVYTMNRPLILTDSTGLQAGKPPDDKPWYLKPMNRDNNPDLIKTDAALTKVFTDTGTVLAASAPMFSTGFNHHKFAEGGKIHTIHIFGNESMTGDAGVFIPKEFKDVKITSQDTVVARNPGTGATFLIDHVQIGSKEKGSNTNKLLRENMKTVRENGTMYIGQIGGQGGEGQKEFSNRGRHAHLVYHPSEAARLEAFKEKAATGGKEKLPEYTPKVSKYLGDFRQFLR